MIRSAAFRPRPRRTRRALLWAALVALLLVAQTLLVALSLSYESSRTQDESEATAAEAAAEVRRELTRSLQALQALMWGEPALNHWKDGAAEYMRTHRALLRVERRDTRLAVTDAVDTIYGAPIFRRMPREDLDVEAEVSCAGAQRLAAPNFSRTYFVPQDDGHGLEVIDLCVPVGAGTRSDGFLVATFSLGALLEAALPPAQARRHELTFVEGDGTRLARAGAGRGSGVFAAERLVDLPGNTLQLRADNLSGRPSVIPNLTTSLVLGLSLALFGVVIALARDVRRRAAAEAALADALGVRKAMEDSLSTGLRARDLDGRVTYANPAFCTMVGFSAEELRGAEQPPYWPPEQVAAYTERQRQRQAAGNADAREGVETVFMRKNGERFPVMIYEAPLVDGQGQHTGWMSAVVDISAQRRMEEISRQQQDRLQASARLATVGEMASLLSHELNQPLAAIASYASGSLNMIDGGADAETVAMLRQGLERIAEQAERAGRIIKSVHHFVRRREQLHETLGADLLVESVLPLVRLQARKSGTRIEVDMPPKAPRVLCDRTMVEQVLLNLTRNGIQAMEDATPLEERVLAIRVHVLPTRWVAFDVVDAGPGIAPDVAQRLFTPFFTTKSEGMGLGLSLCRTVIEQHGGALDFGPGPQGRGTAFRFTLPLPKTASAEVPAAAQSA